MADKEFQVGQTVYLLQDFKTLVAGEPLTVKKVVPIKGGPVYMVQKADGSGKAEGANAEKLTDVAPSAAAPEAPAEIDYSGPVLDYFKDNAQMEHVVGENFFANYFAAHGGEDLVPLIELMDANGIDLGEPWTLEQTAKLSVGFSQEQGENPDPEAVKLIQVAEASRQHEAAKAAEKAKAEEEAAKKAAEPAPAAQPAAAPEAPAAEEKPKRGRKPKEEVAAAEPAAELPPATGRTEYKTWTAFQQDAAELCALALPIIMRNPNHIKALFDQAEKMVNRVLSTPQA